MARARPAPKAEPAGWFPLTFSGGRWRDPVTGLVVPKGLAENCDLRAKLDRKADASAGLRRQLLAACQRSPLLWMNLFVVTFKPLEVDGTGAIRPAGGPSAVPMVTWPVQDHCVDRLTRRIDAGGDLVIDKSRMMGASWLVLLCFLHRWLFRPSYALKVMSRKAELVDNPADPDSLFWKLDFAYERLPWWMRPSHERRSMHLGNLDNGSTIDGESTNADAGRGGRRQGGFFDEAASMPNLAEILAATDMGVACRIFASTPNGPGAYCDLRHSGKPEVVVLSFVNHPELGRGRYMAEEDGRAVASSPARDYAVRHKSRREVAQNWDIDHLASGALYFDSADLNRQRACHACEPAVRGELEFRSRHDAERLVALARLDPAVVAWRERRDGRWRLWRGLVKDEDGRLRPDQSRRYVFGIDVSHGLGDLVKSSNSVICVLDRETGEQVAEFASPTTEPHDLARIAAAAGVWFGGAGRCAFIAWEANGPGLAMTKHLLRTNYPRLYRRVTRERRAEVQTDRLGWHSGRESRLELMGELREDLALDAVLVRSAETLTELGEYVYLRDGSIGPARLHEESAEARATHGDRGVALAVAAHARRHEPRAPAPKFRAPPGSPAEDLEELQRDSDDDDY